MPQFVFQPIRPRRPAYVARKPAPKRWPSLLGTLLAAVLATSPAVAAAPTLTAIVVVSDVSDQPPHAAGVDLSRLRLKDKAGLQRRLNGELSKPQTQETVDQIRTIILEYYKSVGHPFVNVSFLAQGTDTNTVLAVVTEFRVGTVAVEGNSWFSDRFIRDGAGLIAGEPIDRMQLDHGIAALNANPFLKVSPVMEPSDVPETANFVLRTQDRFPVSVSAGYSNTGTPETGWDRWSLGVVWGDALHLGQTVTYQFTSSSDFWHHLVAQGFNGEDPSFLNHTLVWQAPLPWGDQLVLTGAYQRVLPLQGPSTGTVGVTTVLEGEYVVPLRPLPFGLVPAGTSQELGFGFDYKRSNNQLAFGGIGVQSGFTEIDEFLLHYSAILPFSFGPLLVDNALFLSPGHLTSDNTDSAFQQDGPVQMGIPGARARYAYDRLTLTQTLSLPHDFSLVLRAAAQEATTTLLPSEQLSIAGADAVRGYEEYGLAGSRGMLLSVELRLPSFSPTRLILGHEPEDVAQPHVFFDRGEVWNPTASYAAPAYLHTESAGIGGRYQFGRYFALQLDQGWQLIRDARQAANGAFLHISATMTW